MLKQQTMRNSEDNLPDQGADKPLLEFQNSSFRYRADIDDVLKNINLALYKKQKIGIVGRTGAGKSSLTLAICKIIDMTEGQMLIEGLDSANLNLRKLRPMINVIPQDPFIFEGNLRENLDPMRVFSDQQMLEALRMTGLDNFAQFKQGLDSPVIIFRVDVIISFKGEFLFLNSEFNICIEYNTTI